MRKIILKIIGGILFSSFGIFYSSGIVFADDPCAPSVLTVSSPQPSADGRSSWQRAIEEIKESTAQVLMENKNLNKEYESLKQQAKELKIALERYQVQNKTKETGIADFKKLIDEHKQEQKKLEAKILSVENQMQIAKMKNEVKFKMASNEKARQEFAAVEKGIRNDYDEKLKEKEQILKDIEQLESQWQQDKMTVDWYEALQGKKRALLDQIMAMDSQNQQLRTQITDLKKEIETIESNPAIPGKTIR